MSYREKILLPLELEPTPSVLAQVPFGYPLIYLKFLGLLASTAMWINLLLLLLSFEKVSHIVQADLELDVYSRG